MSERLTAAELYAIYTPAFEAAGERPIRLGAELHYREATWQWVLPESRLNPDEPNPDEHEGWNGPWAMGAHDAAAVLRCWAEDRLASRGWVQQLQITNADGWAVDVEIWIGDGDGEKRTWMDDKYHLTIHQALSAAVVAVATAKRAVPGPTGPSPT